MLIKFRDMINFKLFMQISKTELHKTGDFNKLIHIYLILGFLTFLKNKCCQSIRVTK